MFGPVYLLELVLLSFPFLTEPPHRYIRPTDAPEEEYDALV